MEYYITILALYILVGIIACWGLNLQFGEAGVLNFAYIIFVAAGAYTASILTLGPAHSGGLQQYFWGTRLPWPLPWLGAAVVGGVLGLLVGALSLRRLRGDYQAMVLLVISILATYLVSAKASFLNGATGLSQVPAPFQSVLHLSTIGYRLFYIGLAAVATLVVLEVMRRIQGSPLGRNIRAMRENEAAAAAVGHNVIATRLMVMVVGGAVAALAGAIQVQLIGAWAPSSWTYPETFGLFAAVIVGGRGNLGGVALGAFLVQGLFLEGTVLFPNISNPNLVGAAQWISLGLLILIFLWFRPQGVIPERKRTFGRQLEAQTLEPSWLQARLGRSARA